MVVTHNNSKRSLVRNVLTGYLATAVTTLTGFFVTPLLLHYLGDAQFGLWMLLVTILTYLGLVEIGIYATVSKRVAECLATEDMDRLKNVLGTALALYAVLTVIILLLVAVILPFLVPLFHLSPALGTMAQHGLLLLCISRCVAFAFTPQSAVLFGAGRIDLVTLSTMLVNFGSAVVNVVLTLRGGSVVALAGSTAVATLLIGLFNYWIVAQRFPGIVISLRHASRAMARELIKFGSRNSLHSIFGNIAYNSDQIIVGLVMSTAAVANYAVAAKLANMVSVLATKPINVLLPAYSHARAQNDKEREFKLFTESVALSVVVCMPFAIAGCLLGDRIILSWVGHGHEAAYPVVIILLLTTLLVQPGNACAMIMNATERNLFLVRAYIVAAPINLFVSYYATRHFHLLYGPAIGSMVTYLVVDATLLPIVVCREFNFRYRAYLKEGLGSAVLPLLVGSAVTLGLRAPSLPQKKIVTVLMLAVIIATCWSVWFWLALSAERRQSYIDLLQAMRNRRKGASSEAAA